MLFEQVKVHFLSPDLSLSSIAELLTAEDTADVMFSQLQMSLLVCETSAISDTYRSKVELLYPSYACLSLLNHVC